MPERTSVLDSEIVTEERVHFERDTIQEAVAQAVRNMQERLISGELKPSVAEFVRLLELQKELRVEGIKDVKVTWVDPWSEMEAVSEK